MPVVTVLAPPHPQALALLRSIADAVADAIGGGRGDVIAQSATCTASVASGADVVDPWIVVTIQGSARPHERMDRARSAAEAVVRDWARRTGTSLGGVWTQWQCPESAVPTT
ncbi:hypothetical protein ARHIZOSPH14_07220 [Agromyces rhizosphaerae]|uniref:Uncharacterized protein n=1 Tax=Agromyces rhizosphaerae TaxID=88374 RepID=A0A9W6CVJ6_9MICO|nr:hypothetical protein [Agromyces rhizosphaerae]GLI26480.1 hypothetical protein ARHIZOSPH14_07220 [Agromyces rhizosphaerae]